MATAIWDISAEKKTEEQKQLLEIQGQKPDQLHLKIPLSLKVSPLIMGIWTWKEKLHPAQNNTVSESNIATEGFVELGF